MTNTDTIWDAEEASINNSIDTCNVINVSWPERLVSVGVGAFLLSAGLRGLTRRPGRSLVRTAIGGYLLFRGASGNCKLYSALGKTRDVHHPDSINVRTSLLVNRPRNEVYQFWRNLENLPSFMSHLVRVNQVDDIHSRWEAKLPGLGKVKWTAEIVKDEYGSMLGWQSISDSTIQNAGKVEFRDGENGGTEVRVIITYRAPAGDIGAGIAKLLNPVFASIVEKDILDFKHHMEAKETAFGEL